MRRRSKIRKLQKQIAVIENSNLTESEKQNAINALRKSMVLTTVVVVALTILIAIAITVGFSISVEIGAVVALLSMVLMMIVLIIFAVMLRKSNTMSPWTDAQENLKSKQ